MQQLFFLALPTPSEESGAANLSYIMRAASELGKHIKDYKVIVDKSTVPVGTSSKVALAIRANTSSEFGVVSNPEFLREGSAIQDFINPDRVIIGSSCVRAKDIMRDLYKKCVPETTPIICMDEESAELTKYAANAFLATKISFMNEIANICAKVGADIDNVRLGMGYDKRIGNQFLLSGIGYGGSCFAKDIRELINLGNTHENKFQILDAVSKINKKQQVIQIDSLLKYFNDSKQGNLKDKKIALWGLSFKPETDDIRDAPSLAIIEKLLQYDAQVIAYDPVATKNIQRLIGNQISYASDKYKVLHNADCLLILTEWQEFQNPDFPHMHNLMNGKAIFDGRNIYSIALMQQQQFYYHSIGRSTVKN